MTEVDRQPWWRGARGEWYVIAQVGLFALVGLGPRALPGLPQWGAPWSVVSLIAGLALGMVGGLLALAGLINLGNNLTALPHPKDDAVLVRSGAYALVRHPIYSGLVLAAFALALVTSSPAAIVYATILLVFFDVKSRREERWLVERYGDYAAYQKRVRKLIPFVY
jgi:protein-S-isoprenylcysteine O-methyltransferase Ste14